MKAKINHLSRYQDQRVPLICCLELESAFWLKIATLPCGKKKKEGKNQKKQKADSLRKFDIKGVDKGQITFRALAIQSTNKELTLPNLLTVVFWPLSTRLIHREQCMGARRYEISRRVFNSISQEWERRTREVSYHSLWRLAKKTDDLLCSGNEIC